VCYADGEAGQGPWNCNDSVSRNNADTDPLPGTEGLGTLFPQQHNHPSEIEDGLLAPNESVEQSLNPIYHDTLSSSNEPYLTLPLRTLYPDGDSASLGSVDGHGGRDGVSSGPISSIGSQSDAGRSVSDGSYVCSTSGCGRRFSNKSGLKYGTNLSMLGPNLR
jgi:hypothetical protein